MICDLIYDIGMNNGDDTAYFLHKGYRVVGVEADPTLTAKAERRFARELSAERLMIVQCGITDREGLVPFWICEEHSDWNSFDRSLAARNGGRCHQIDIEGRRFGSILSQFGTPYYLKIDIEGNDHLCIRDLDSRSLPKYLSTEMNSPTASDVLPRLKQLGYTAFKGVSQYAFFPLRLTSTPDQISWQRWLRFNERHSTFFRVLKRLGGRQLFRRRWQRLRSDGDWVFPPGCSGPFGESTPGPWYDYDEFLNIVKQLNLRRTAGDPSVYWKSGGSDFWADLHAKRSDDDE